MRGKAVNTKCGLIDRRDEDMYFLPAWEDLPPFYSSTDLNPQDFDGK